MFEGRVRDDVAVAYNFVKVDRDQRFLLPPDMREWLPEGHLAWFVIDVVDSIDLAVFRSAYRADGHGRAAYDPAMMTALLLYAYCSGVRSSRVIERRCVEDIAYRVLAGGQAPDHVTISRFRQRHQDALAGVLVESLRLCAEAGLVRLGLVALDGTKIAADASRARNHTLGEIEQQVADMLADAEAVDRREAGDEGEAVPRGLASRAGRLARLKAAKQRLEADAAARSDRFEARSDQLNEARAGRGLAAKQYRPRRRDEAPRPDAKANTTDPDSQIVGGTSNSVQGYNAQAVVTAEQIVVAAEVVQAPADVEQLAPMLDATHATLRAASIEERPAALVADAGYWRAENVNGSIVDAPELFIAVARHGRRGKPRRDGRPSESKTDQLVDAMTARLASDTGRAMMRARRTSVEPFFGQIKEARAARRFLRRGLAAVQAEWKLLCATNNLLKLWRHQTTT